MTVNRGRCGAEGIHEGGMTDHTTMSKVSRVEVLSTGARRTASYVNQGSGNLSATFICEINTGLLTSAAIGRRRF